MVGPGGVVVLVHCSGYALALGWRVVVMMAMRMVMINVGARLWWCWYTARSMRSPCGWRVMMMMMRLMTMIVMTVMMIDGAR